MDTVDEKPSTSTPMEPTLKIRLESIGVDQATPVDTGTVISEITNGQAMTLFFVIARQAIQKKQITNEIVRTIYRPRTRKQNYWKRHLMDLIGILHERGYSVEFPGDQ